MTIDLSCGGRLTVDPRVNAKKVERMAELSAGAKLGGFDGERARVHLAETLSTSDAPFSFAHLVNLRNLPEYDEVEVNLDPITHTETAPDFRPITFWNLQSNFEGLEYGKDNDGERVAPKVAELDTYQYAFGYTQEDTSLAVEKRGFKVGWSLERGVNDPYGLVTRFPSDMLKVGVKTDEFVRIRALVEGVTTASEFVAGEDFISGETVPADAPPTAAALRVAIRQINDRTDANGARVPTPARFNLVVAQGMSDQVEYGIGLARGLFQVQDGNLTYRAPVGIPDPLARITNVIESEFVTGNEWYLVPEASAVEKPALVRVQLAGYTAPEVYVSNFNGTPLMGGASSDPFTAFSFDNDSIDLKFRQFVNAAVFSEEAIVWSNGTAG